MRMWMIPPQYMCKKHISGEHNEIHKHLPSLYAGVKIDGRFAPVVQIQLNALQRRHDELSRHLNHSSPLSVDDALIQQRYMRYYLRRVDINYNVYDLIQRCPECRKKLLDKVLFKPWWVYRMAECQSVSRRIDAFIHRIPLALRLDLYNGRAV